MRPPRRFPCAAPVRLLALALTLTAPAAPYRALVGAAPDDRFADRVAMVLMRGRGEAGFCSALVLDDRTVLTAAHCLRRVQDMAIYHRDASGAPVVIPVEAALAHPAYRPDAIRARAVSIDVALVRASRPLGAGFVGARLAAGEGPSVGDPVILAGFGSTAAGDWKSGGVLRSETLTVREPASPVLVWAADPDGHTAGACSGDSGAPMFSGDGTTAVAIATWAQAAHGRGCGGLTQGPRLAPLADWIESARERLAGAR